MHGRQDAGSEHNNRRDSLVAHHVRGDERLHRARCICGAGQERHRGKDERDGEELSHGHGGEQAGGWLVVGLVLAPGPLDVGGRNQNENVGKESLRNDDHRHFPKKRTTFCVLPLITHDGGCRLECIDSDDGDGHRYDAILDRLMAALFSYGRLIRGSSPPLPA